MAELIRRILSSLLTGDQIPFRTGTLAGSRTFDRIVGYDGIKRTFARSLNSKEPVHILLVGPPGQAKTQFLKSVLERFGEKKAFFTVGVTPANLG